MADTHFHLAPYGFTLCAEPGCQLERADPAADQVCTDPNCEGNCEAARYNAARRAHLESPLQKLIAAGLGDMTAGELYRAQRAGQLEEQQRRS